MCTAMALWVDYTNFYLVNIGNNNSQPNDRYNFNYLSQPSMAKFNHKQSILNKILEKIIFHTT